MKSLVGFEMFRPALEAAVPRADRSKGGPFNHVFMFKVLILQVMHSLSDERCEYLIKDRPSFMRSPRLRLADAVPDAYTIWTLGEPLKKTNAADALFRRFDEALRAAVFQVSRDARRPAVWLATWALIPAALARLHSYCRVDKKSLIAKRRQETRSISSLIDLCE